MDQTEDRGPLVLGVVWAEIGLAAILFSARFYARVTFNAHLGADDWTMLVAIVCMP